MIKNILLGFLLILGLSVQSQTQKKVGPSYENTIKNYVKWFESLPDYKKREESIIMVNKLNRMSANDRGIWLATAAKYGKSPEVKKNIIDSLSNEGVKKKLFILLPKNVLESDQKVETIVIVSSSTAKERTVAINTEIRKKIADLKVEIEEADRIMAKTNDEDKMYRDASFKSESAKFDLPRLRENIITYSGTKDDRWNSYLIDEYELEIQILVPHKQTDEELDSGISSGIKFDKVKKKFTAKFIKGTNYYGDTEVRDDKHSSFSITYHGEVKNDDKKESSTSLLLLKKQSDEDSRILTKTQAVLKDSIQELKMKTPFILSSFTLKALPKNCCMVYSETKELYKAKKYICFWGEFENDNSLNLYINDEKNVMKRIDSDDETDDYQYKNDKYFVKIRKRKTISEDDTTLIIESAELLIKNLATGQEVIKKIYGEGGC